ncbi:MAG: monofunctional biosynthetic peptidoglycan transglycosylase [Nitrospirales bacterium]|nr:monofunctional biosynthetic peptidoglycan transglycosylase [Nitrospirales bacterium]
MIQSACSIILWVAVLSLCILGIELATLPYAQIPSLINMTPTETALMRQRREEALAHSQTFTLQAQWIPLKAIPDHVVSAILVSEDAAFYSHQGFDWNEILESLKLNIERQALVRGGSTLSQQLIKNLFLSSEKNALRKFKEAVLTYSLEKHLSKNRILELYLNLVEWGDGIFGIDAAARHYFQKPVTWLSHEEGARLAAVLPNPRHYQPNRNSTYVVRRKTQILHRLTSYAGPLP